MRILSHQNPIAHRFCRLQCGTRIPFTAAHMTPWQIVAQWSIFSSELHSGKKAGLQQALGSVDARRVSCSVEPFPHDSSSLHGTYDHRPLSEGRIKECRCRETLVRSWRFTNGNNSRSPQNRGLHDARNRELGGWENRSARVSCPKGARSNYPGQLQECAENELENLAAHPPEPRVCVKIAVCIHRCGPPSKST
ncbi:hypothetical protein LshimejAT787_0704170 [Lyophyllum shimeji]|uniref:Uncharacterized protein n=1 Tax=Lyophyllum shimeji TaxID=47721 RepID=A0A9P3PNW6_LYOSH|nr:hypothetical protein LshimejAT787_0704170 [Lyophyllum shimeji]